jgi:hypothetical protein
MILTNYVEKDRHDELEDKNEQLNKRNTKIMDENYQLIKDRFQYERERAAFFKASAKLFKRGMLELLLQTCLNRHQTCGKNNNKFVCGNKAFPTSFSSIMAHWRTCELEHPTNPPMLLTSAVDGLLKLNATEADVGWAIDNLHNTLSKDLHFDRGETYPIQVVKFADDYNTLALLSFFKHYKIQSVLVGNEIPSTPPQDDKNDDNLNQNTVEYKENFNLGEDDKIVIEK